ncbi:MAG: C45 family peptidase [Mediterranea sp.]|jgi:hypothetical protein|nr:C45 family peptidase [Mediterranea sp.]
MHKRRVKRIAKYTGIALLILLLVPTIGLTYLYFSADMCTPRYTPVHTTAEVIWTDSLRQYGDNYLRHSRSGLWELKVKGDAFERGEAIGRMSADLLHYQEKVFVDQIREIIPSERYLKFLRFFIVLFNRNLGRDIPEEYRDEIYGISLSCTHDYDFIGTPYERQLNYHAAHDIGHAMQDYMLVGCSSFATWGEESADSTLLIGRNFDFYVGDGFARNKLVAFYTPEHGYRFASVGWPGMIGVLSGMNEKGLTVTINAAKSAIPTSSATPISILTREILQYASNIREAYAIAQKRQTFVSESILVGSAEDGRAAIIEKSPEKTALYYGDHPHQLICTNHFQSEAFAHDERNLENIRTSDSPYRFARIRELLQEQHPIDVPKAAFILRNRQGTAGADLGMGNELAVNQLIAHHSVIFQPERRMMWVSTSPWQCGPYVAYDLNHIFADSVDFHHEIALPQAVLPADAFLQSSAYPRFLAYRKLTSLLRGAIRQKTRVSRKDLDYYLSTNPRLYHPYEVVGDYYEAIGQPAKAIDYWTEALTKPMKPQEADNLQRKIEKAKKES